MFLTACQHLGPWALEQGRERYNEKIHLTSREQLFANIIRVANNETLLFMDVSEVDAAELIQGMATGGVTGLGGLSDLQGAGQVVQTGFGMGGPTGAIKSSVVSSRAGAVAGSFGYQESPTIRYFPLAGQALVAQIATPISVTSIANLFSSDWPFLSVLDLSLDRITPNYNDYFAALNAIVALDDYGALVVTAAKSDATKPEPPTPRRIDGTNFTIQTTPPEQQGIDSLTLYLQPAHPDLTALNVDPQYRVAEETWCIGQNYTQKFYAQLATDDSAKLILAKRNIMHLWIRLLRLYANTQADSIWPQGKPHHVEEYLAALDNDIGVLSDSDLNRQFEKLPKKIELRSSVAPTRKEDSNSSPQSKAPIIQAHSALGILLNRKRIEFLTHEAYQPIRKESWNNRSSDNAFYTLLTRNENSLCNLDGKFCYNHPADTKAQQCVSNWISDNKTNSHLTFSIKTDISSYPAIENETNLGQLRRNLLIIVTDDPPPPDAFVFYRSYGKTFYIDGGDVISRKNFALLSQFMTMQAVPPTTAPLTPTISVGAGG